MTRIPRPGWHTADHHRSPKAPTTLAPLVLAAILIAAAAAPFAVRAGDPPAAGGDGREVALLAGGCFWGMEQLVRELDGVVDTEVGYVAEAGNQKSKPAEAVRLVFDPDRISYEAILRTYFRIHDPTTRNRQGNDVGAKYRSAIFVLDDEQRRVAEKVRAEVDSSGFWKKPLVTEISAAGDFEVAPEFHQDYLVKNPGGYTCHYERE
jgi:methionine-S-sulfoxide reductase